jgi:hypothetical protein
LPPTHGAEHGAGVMAIRRDELFEILNQDEVRGRVVRDAAALEDSLSLALTFYFTTNQRYESFEEPLLPRLSLNDKVGILERLPYRRQYKSLGAFKLIRQLQRVRNILAHRSYVSDYPKELKADDWCYLFENWPSTYDRVVGTAHRYLSRLLNPSRPPTADLLPSHS